MTMQAEELLGAQVTGADGKVVGTVEQVFRDDVDGTPAWARVRSGKTGRFVPLAGGQVTKNGLQKVDLEKLSKGVAKAIDSGSFSVSIRTSYSRTRALFSERAK